MQQNNDALALNAAAFAVVSQVSLPSWVSSFLSQCLAVICGGLRRNWSGIGARAISSGLETLRLTKGGTASVPCREIHEVIELQLAVPVSIAVLNATSTKCETEKTADILVHTDKADISSFCRANLAGFKTPKAVIFHRIAKYFSQTKAKFSAASSCQGDKGQEGKNHEPKHLSGIWTNGENARWIAH